MTDTGVRITRGILPWRKWDGTYPYSIIFQAGYRHSFLGWVFRYGTVSVKRTEGITTTTATDFVHNARQLAGLINRAAEEHRQVMKPPAAAAAPAPAGDGGIERLAELPRLKANGDLTADEYEQMKSRVIGQPDAPPATAPL